MKTVDFSETIAACDLKVGRCRQLIELMKACEYCSQGPKVIYIWKLKLAFLRNHWAIFNQILCLSF